MIRVTGITGAALALLMTLCAAMPAPALAMPAKARSVRASQTIFYSGGGHAGENSGKDAGAYVMVEQSYKDYEVWKGTRGCPARRGSSRRRS